MAKFRTSNSGRKILTSAADFHRRNNLPYGLWICPDGREILFNRFYEPLWQRYPGQNPTPANPTEFIKFAKQSWFYKDSTKDKTKVAEQELTKWNIEIPKRTRVSK